MRVPKRSERKGRKVPSRVSGSPFANQWFMASFQPIRVAAIFPLGTSNRAVPIASLTVPGIDRERIGRGININNISNYVPPLLSWQRRSWLLNHPTMLRFPCFLMRRVDSYCTHAVPPDSHDGDEKKELSLLSLGASTYIPSALYVKYGPSYARIYTETAKYPTTRAFFPSLFIREFSVSLCQFGIRLFSPLTRRGAK